MLTIGLDHLFDEAIWQDSGMVIVTLAARRVLYYRATASASRAVNSGMQMKVRKIRSNESWVIMVLFQVEVYQKILTPRGG